MQNVMDVITPNPPTVSEADAQRAAGDYVAAHIDPSFAVVSGAQVKHKASGRKQWQFIIRCEHGPLYPIYVDAQSGMVTPLTDNEIQVVHQKAAIFVARQQGRLPVDEQGYVLAEYARRQADSYLGGEVSLFYSAIDGVFIPVIGKSLDARWRFSVQVRLPKRGVLGVIGVIEVDAKTGEVIRLTSQQSDHMRENADALVEFRTQTATA
jgi:hypothetical protein